MTGTAKIEVGIMWWGYAIRCMDKPGINTKYDGDTLYFLIKGNHEEKVNYRALELCLAMQF